MSNAYKLNPDGTITTIRVSSEQKAHELQANPRLFDAMLAGLGAYNEQEVSDRSKKIHERRAQMMECFYCQDSGLIAVRLVRNNHQYETVYVCKCLAGEPYKKNTANILELVSAGAYNLSCQLGGKEGENCHLLDKHLGNCSKHKCPKFS